MHAFLVSLLALALLAAPTGVDTLAGPSAPPPPFSPYGTVKVDGQNVSNGTVVSAWCNGVSYRSTTTQTQLGESWYYNLDIPGDDPNTSGVTEGCHIGEVVSFKVGEAQAVQTAPWASGTLRLDLTASGPIAVTLASFRAESRAGHVLVTWETVSEIDNTGFNLYRSTEAEGARTLLAFVPATNPGSTAGASYAVEDHEVLSGVTYWYWLEDIDLRGWAKLHGPVSANYQAPTATQLTGFQAGNAERFAPGWVWLVAALGCALILSWRLIAVAEKAVP